MLRRHAVLAKIRRRFAGLDRWVPSVLVGLAMVGAWYLVSLVALDDSNRFLLPRPDEIIAVLRTNTLAEIAVAVSHTASVALLGLTIAIAVGVTWAVAMSQGKWIERSLFPYAVVLQCIPILALVPLVGFWFGFDRAARVIVCVLVALFPMVSNTLFGLQAVDPRQRDLFTLRGASRWAVLIKLELPTALPAIFAGMRISAGLAVVGAIVGDFFFRRGETGIGVLISTYQSRVQSAELFAAILVASLLGVATFAAFGWLGNRVVGKWQSTQTS